MPRHDPWQHDTRTIARHRGRPPWPESVHRTLRICAIVAAGAALTAVGLAWTGHLHTFARAATAAAPAASPVVAYNDPPWTVPQPTATATPSATPSPSRPAARKPAPAKPSPTHSTPPTPQPGPTPSAQPVLLGPGGDDTVEAAFTTYCVQVRGVLAVAALSDADTWGCRHAEKTTPLNVDAACRWFYGASAWAKTLNDADPYSWRCYRD
jgi:hypothetical protein